MCLIVAMFCGPLSVRRRIRSSWKTTSSTQCRRFSIPQWARTARARSCGPGGKRGQQEAPREGGYAIAFDLRFDHGDRFQAGEARLAGGAAWRLQPTRVMADPVAAGLDAAIVSFSVSCDGMPRAKGKIVRKNRSFYRPQPWISTKSSAPARVPHRINSMISRRGNTTLPR